MHSMFYVKIPFYVLKMKKKVLVVGYKPTPGKQNCNQAQLRRPFGVTNSLQRWWQPTNLMLENMWSGYRLVLKSKYLQVFLRKCLWCLSITMSLCGAWEFHCWKMSKCQRYIKVLGWCKLCKLDSLCIIASLIKWHPFNLFQNILWSYSRCSVWNFLAALPWIGTVVFKEIHAKFPVHCLGEQ